MSLRLEMIQVARLAPKLLGDSSELVEAFLRSQQSDDGGFSDRDGNSDLYYTVFGLDSLIALNVEVDFDRLESHLHGFGDGERLDFVHLCCLARAWSAMPDLNRLPTETRAQICQRITGFRAEDGGYNPKAHSPSGTAYGAFLALGAHQDLRIEFPEPLRAVQSLKFLETSDGAWTNDRLGPTKIGSTNATAAAITTLRNLNAPINRDVADWLMHRSHDQGGFRATPETPIPDLLSTATALHSLSGLEASIEPVKDSCLDFLDTLWTNDGSFYGNWTEETLDCEYTFYALLALGHLSL
jgi:prenyltransferase beta subunit